MIKNTERYNQFTVKDFILDTDFIRYVISKGDRDMLFWGNWTKLHPDKEDIIKEAKVVIELMNLQETNTGNTTVLWQNLKKRHKDITQLQEIQTQAKTYKRVLILVGTLLTLSVAGLFLWMYHANQKQTVYKTDSKQVAHILLPDKSEITINENTKAEIRSASLFNPARSIVLDGEAFVNVKPKTFLGIKQSFVIKTDYLKISVLGTSFNVKTNDSTAQIYLKEGKVVLSEMPNLPSLTLEPGDFVTIDKKTNTITKKKLANDFPIVWKNNEVKFENSPVAEVLQYLSVVQNVNLVNNALQVSSKSFTGVFPVSDKNILIKALEEAYDIKVMYKNDLLIVNDKIKR